MKAYQIMRFLFIFNMVFWMVTTGLGFFVVDVSTDPGFELSDASQDPDLGILSVFTLFGNQFATIIGLSLAVAGGALIGIFTAGQGAQGVVYGLFSYFFWSAMSNTLTVFYNISGQSIAIVYLLAIFTMIIGVVFAAGLFQMVTGGWRAHE